MADMKSTDKLVGTGASNIPKDINEQFVSNLVDNFYAKIRLNPDIGPVFEGAIRGEWDPHLAKMKKFWGAMVFEHVDYSGRPIPKHMDLRDRPRPIEEQHFEIWLRLFQETIKELPSSPEIETFFMNRARQMEKSFRYAIFGVSGIPRKSRS